MCVGVFNVCVCVCVCVCACVRACVSVTRGVWGGVLCVCLWRYGGVGGGGGVWRGGS